jgi:hypothetical protein
MAGRMLGMCLMAQEHDGVCRRGADLRGSNWRSRRRAVLVSRRPRRHAPSVVALFSGRPPRSLSREKRRQIEALVVEYGAGASSELRAQVQRVLMGEPLAPVDVSTTDTSELTRWAGESSGDGRRGA